MKERPILMSAPMVRALLDGCKTQTRRVAKLRGHDGIQKEHNLWWYLETDSMTANQFEHHKDGMHLWQHRADISRIIEERCPYQPGNRLWVKETFGITESAPYADGQVDEAFVYRADGWKDDSGHFKWKPSIFMPRHAARILLEITDVRVERLQDISEEDAKEEGVQITDEWTGCADDLNGSHVQAYRHLWESINGAGSWDANPWVWVVAFEVCHDRP